MKIESMLLYGFLILNIFIMLSTSQNLTSPSTVSSSAVVILNPAPLPIISGLSFYVQPSTAHPGEEVSLYLNQPAHPVVVYFNDRPLPKKTSPDGKVIVVPVPGDAKSGSWYFQLQYNGQMIKSQNMLTVSPLSSPPVPYNGTTQPTGCSSFNHVPAGFEGYPLMCNSAYYCGYCSAIQWDDPHLNDIFNDKVSSLLIPEYFEVTLYPDYNYGGIPKTFTANTPFVGDDLKASSITIKRPEGNPAWQGDPTPNSCMQDILDAQNNIRQDAGVPPMRWSSLLANHAQFWADALASTGGGCDERHDITWLEHLNENENLWSGSPPGPAAWSCTAGVNDAPTSWVSEKERRGQHYVTMTGGGYKYCGCAKAIATKPDNNGDIYEYLVCHYFPWH